MCGCTRERHSHPSTHPPIHPYQNKKNAPLRERRALPLIQADRLAARQLHQHLAGARVLLRAEPPRWGKVPLRPKQRVLQPGGHHAGVPEPSLEGLDGVLLVDAELERVRRACSCLGARWWGRESVSILLPDAISIQNPNTHPSRRATAARPSWRGAARATRPYAAALPIPAPRRLLLLLPLRVAAALGASARSRGSPRGRAARRRPQRRRQGCSGGAGLLVVPCWLPPVTVC